MLTEHESYLFESYPILYGGKDKPLTKSLMAFGFECGDGWFELLDDLSRKIEEINLKVASPPWYAKAWNWVRGKTPVAVEAMQVKEKFGTLRFYYSGPASGKYRNAVLDLVSKAERLSETTCEACGSPAGKLRSSKSWWAYNRCCKCWDFEEQVPIGG